MMPSSTLRFTALKGSELELTGESVDDDQLRSSHYRFRMHRRLDGNGNANIDCSLGSSNDQDEDCPFASTYGCFNEPLQDRLTLYFDYEVYYTSRQPPLDFLQGSLLERVAKSFNVARDCSDRRILQQAVPITALSSRPRDSVNNHASCQAPVETAMQEAASCQPVLGKMSVWVPSAPNSLTVTSQVLKEIRSIMSKDSLVVDTSAGSIHRLIFMGQQGVDIEKAVSVPPELSPDAPESIRGDQTLSAAAIASLSMLTFSSLLCIIFAYHRGKKRVTSSQRKETLEIQTSMPETPTTMNSEHFSGDLEATLTSPHPTRPSTNNDNDTRSFDVVENHIHEAQANSDDSPERMLVNVPSSAVTLETNENDKRLAGSHSSTSEEDYLSFSWNQNQSDKTTTGQQPQPP